MNCSFFVHGLDIFIVYNKNKPYNVGCVARGARATLWQALFLFFQAVETF
jgi:hypothetical protein